MKKVFFALSCMLGMIGFTSCEMEHHEHKTTPPSETQPAAPERTNGANGTNVTR